MGEALWCVVVVVVQWWWCWWAQQSRGGGLRDICWRRDSAKTGAGNTMSVDVVHAHDCLAGRWLGRAVPTTDKVASPSDAVEE